MSTREGTHPTLRAITAGATGIMRHAEEARRAFGRAITEGRLSSDEHSPLYAGHYMFMGLGTRPDGSKYDAFKHSATRQYVTAYPTPASEAEAIHEVRRLGDYDERWKATALEVLRKVEALLMGIMLDEEPGGQAVVDRLAEVQTLIALREG